MKEWMCWVLLVAGVIMILWFGWWLTTIFSTMVIYYITVVVNVIVWGYLYYQDKTKGCGH